MKAVLARSAQVVNRMAGADALGEAECWFMQV